MVAMEVASALCLGPEDQPPDEGPNGEMEGAAGSEGAAIGRGEVGDAGRELAATDAGAETWREGAGDVAGRALDEGETPLRSSSNGIRRCAWMSFSRPSSR